MPEFYIAGAMKAGTTSLYHYLRQHPALVMSRVKEPHYFAFPDHEPTFNGPGDQDAIRQMRPSDRDAYLALFGPTHPGQLRGEASAMYLYYPEVAERIRAEVPDAKIIVVLRDPVERAYSSFMHLIRDGREPVHDFSAALLLERERMRQNWMPLWHYVEAGRYAGSVEHYLEVFGRGAVKILLTDDLLRDPVGTVAEVFAFLGVDDTFLPDLRTSYNPSGAPRSRTLHRLIRTPNPLRAALKPLLPRNLRVRLSERVVRWNLVRPPPLAAETRAELVARFEHDIERLQELTELDLSRWLRA